MSIQYYYSAVHDDILAAIAEGASAPSLERVVEYSYIPDQTDEDHQEAARVDIHAVWIVRHLSRDRWKQADVADLLTDEEVAKLEAETLSYHESVRIRRLMAA